jgi:D-glycero-D-manno-heptose 1,7-bisphosphate phosphatase
MIKLAIFDADGTICDRESGEFLPGVDRVMEDLRVCNVNLAIASNQGGVGCRALGGFGYPERYPTEAQTLDRYRALADHIGARLYLCFAYQTRDGQWSDAPADALAPEFWRRDWRKPQPGMLLQAMRDFGVLPNEALFIGDRPEDEIAAARAGAWFVWAKDFLAAIWG